MVIPEHEDEALDVIAGLIEQGFHELAPVPRSSSTNGPKQRPGVEPGFSIDTEPHQPESTTARSKPTGPSR